MVGALMSPDRVMVLADWVRWKHRFTVLVLGLIATTIVACVIGLWSLNTTNAQRAENIRGDTQLQENFADANRGLIIANCKAVEEFKTALRQLLADLTPDDKETQILPQYDRRVPPIDCTHIPTTLAEAQP